MEKCNEREVKKCKKLLKKCEKKQQNCTCGSKMEKENKKEPNIQKEDLLWAYFVFRMISEVLTEPGTRDKLKAAAALEKETMFELAALQEALGIMKGTIAPSVAAPATSGLAPTTSKPGAPPAKTGAPPPSAKPGNPPAPGK